MKRFIAFLLLLSAFPCAHAAEDADEIIPIVQTRPSMPTETYPKAPAFIPIEAEFSRDSQSIEIFYRYDVGVVEVSLSELSSGDIVSFSHQGIGTVILPAVLASGRYLITFTLPDGREYQGEFEI